MDRRIESFDWALVQAFLAVAEAGSLSGAARVLGTSQPTLGRQIKAIETQLGAELFRRQPRGFALTKTGAALVAPAQAMRDAVRQIALTAAGQQEQLEGTVRITASVATLVIYLPPVIAHIRNLEPDIAIELVKLAFDEIPPLPHDGLMHLVDHSSFTNPRKTGHQH